MFLEKDDWVVPLLFIGVWLNTVFHTVSMLLSNFRDSNMEAVLYLLQIFFRLKENEDVFLGNLVFQYKHNNSNKSHDFLHPPPALAKVPSIFVKCFNGLLTSYPFSCLICHLFLYLHPICGNLRLSLCYSEKM